MDDLLSRKRAESALNAIETFEQEYRENKKVRKAYLSYIKNTPVLIRRHGLGQALATILAQSQGQGDELAYKGIYNHLQDWLCSNSDYTPFDKIENKKKENLLKCVVQSNQKEYFEAQNEAGIYIELLKKFANAFLSDGLETEESSEHEGEPS